MLLLSSVVSVVSWSALSPAQQPRLPRLARTAIQSRGVAMVAAEPTLAAPPAFGAKMPTTWVPIASDHELDPERPTPVRFLNKRYVIWRDNEVSKIAQPTVGAAVHRRLFCEGSSSQLRTLCGRRATGA